MPVPRSVPPAVLKEMVVRWGYKVIAEDEYTWVLAQGDTDEPIVLPKEGDLVATDVLMNVLISAKLHLGAFLALKKQVMGEEPEHQS